jgi:hypothetical protein
LGCVIHYSSAKLLAFYLDGKEAVPLSIPNRCCTLASGTARS